MASKTSTVVVQILGDADPYKKEMAEVAKTTDKTTKSLDKSTDESAKKMGNWAKGVVLAVGVVALNAVKNFVKDAVRAFSDLNESLNAVEVTYGDASEGILKLGEEAAKSLGLSNAEFNSFAVQMSAFAKTIAGDGGDVVAVVDELSTRVSDFASVMNLEVAEAARLFQSGLAGETEPLRKYGIDLSAAAVNAHAVAVGISDGTGQLTEQEKVMARHSLLMDQTSASQGDFANTATDLANATRIANAQIENNKALVGEALQGAYQAALPAMVDLSAAAADVAIRFLEVTGKMDDTTAALQRFQLESGEAVDNITNVGKAAAETNPEIGWGTDLIDLWTGSQEKANETFREGISTLDLLSGSVQDQQNEVKLLAAELGFTEEQEQAFIDILNEEIVAQTNAERSAGQHRGAIDRLGEGIDDTTEDVKEATTALEKYQDEIRSQIDPLFALLDAEDKVAASMQAVVDATTEFGEGSPEWQQATRDLARANGDLIAAQLKVAEQSGFTRDEFNVHLQQMGNMTQEQIDFILTQFDRANQYNWREQIVNVKVRGVDVPMGFGLPRAHSGGVIAGPRGREVPIIAQAGETILPLDHKNGNGGGTVNNYVTVQTLDGQAAGRAVLEALQSLMRSNGPLPLSIRSP